MRKGFTLTEIVISIVILGLLAGIILVNVFDTKDKAIATHIEGNIAALQRATDAYYIEEEQYPTEREPSFGRPEKLLLDRLSPKYIHKADLDAVKHQTYEVDVDGRVWGSTAGSPEVVFETQEGVRWTPSERAVAYDVYQDLGRQADVNHRLKKVSRLKGLPESKQYLYREKNVLLSAVDRFGKATAPTQMGTNQFVPRLNFEGTFDYIVDGDELFVLDALKTYELKPEGTSISYRFTTYDVKGDVLRDGVETFPKGEKAAKVKVTVEMKGTKEAKPSLKGMILHYHYESQEEILLTLVPKDLLPKNLLEECAEGCGAYRLPYRSIVEQTASIRDTAAHGSNSSSNHSASRFVFREDFVLVYGQAGERIPEGITLLKDTALTIGEPSEQALEVDEGNANGDEHLASSVVTEKGWTTVESQFIVAGNPKERAIHWIEAIIEDEVKDKENTKIVYRYSYYKGSGFTGGGKNISELPDSSSIRLTVNRMVRTKMVGKTEEPVFKSATFRSEKGVVNLDGVRPTAFISYEKDNNIGRDVISTTSKVSWKYEAFDPRGKEIADVRWSGDVATTYPVPGKKTIILEVKNSSGYWSTPTSYSFEVKNEIPVAKLNPEYALLRTGEDVDWSKADLSIDPDGDDIVEREWQGVSSRYTEEGGTFIARLRVKDAEGYWSLWTELPYTTCKDVCFKGFDNNLAWDGKLGTMSTTTSKTVSWTGDLKGRTVTFDYDFYEYASFRVKNEKGEDLPIFLTTSNEIVTKVKLSSAIQIVNSRKIVSFIVPEDAKFIAFDNFVGRINEFIVGGKNLLETPQNLRALPKAKEVTLEWDSVPKASKYYIFEGNTFAGETLTTKFTHSSRETNTPYVYSVMASDSKGVFSRKKEIRTSTLDDGINFRGFSTPKAWDDNLSTKEVGTSKTITWSGALGGKKITMDFFEFSSAAKFSIKNSAGEDLPISLVPSNKVVTVVRSSHVQNFGSRRIVSFIMPQNAQSIVFQQYAISLYEITVSPN